MTKLYLFHGSGAGHDSQFLTDFRAFLQCQIDLPIEPFTLDYMQQMLDSAKRRPPPSIDRLIEEASRRIDRDTPVILVGKSMGARIIAELCQTHNVLACVALGYPFYPAKRTEKDRLHHLSKVGDVPCLIVQGSRDNLGSPAWVAQQRFANNIHFHWLEGADHDFNVLKRYNRSRQDVLADIANVVKQFISA